MFGDVLDGVREAVTPAELDAVGPLPDGASTDPAASAGSGSGDVAERAGRLVLKALEEAGGLDVLAAAHEAVSAYHGNNYLPLLDQHYRSHRSALFTLVDSIDLESTNAERSVLDAVKYLQAQRNARAVFVPGRISVEHAGPDGAPVAVELVSDVDAFASAAWRKILKNPDRPGLLVRRHLEVCVFSYLASELKPGDIAVAGSDSYANLHDQLMSWEECEPLVEGFCAEAGLPTDPRELTGHYRQLLADTAAGVDSGYPANTDPTLEGRRPVLKRRKGAERTKEALKLEEAVHERLPRRDLLDILTRTAYQTCWTRHLGPASGSDPKIKEALGRYVLMVFAYGSLLGPAQVAAHMRGKVSAAEIAMTANKHSTSDKISKASSDVINEFNKLDIASVWGDGKAVAADGFQIETWENNLLAEIQPDTIHADTQGQSLPVFGLAALMGFDLLPRIRHWHDLIFYRPTPGTRYQHIDSLFGDEVIDWTLIETHWTDLLRTAISIRENRLSSVTLLRRLGNHSRKNRLYRAFRELGRAVRTITLLRYLSDPDLREQITQVTNRNESFHNFADSLMFGGKLIGHNDPDYQEKIIKFNELLADCVIYSTAQDITDAANAIAADGHPVDLDDLATISPYITHVIRRFGNGILNLTPPAANPTTRLDLESPSPLRPITGGSLAAPGVLRHRRAADDPAGLRRALKTWADWRGLSAAAH
ncbi:Tn3 family transposase [Nonomuraea sp. NPDC049709]|uniref:Tn3 family transposase n=1 Tax=Nonomuraea sp. NPDC049709 TaxID=3154736 RepID=UPI00342727D8